MKITAAGHRTVSSIAAFGLATVILMACGGGGASYVEPLRGPEPRPATGEAVDDPITKLDRPDLDTPLLLGAPREVVLLDAGAAPHQELRLHPELGTVQRVKVIQQYGTLHSWEMDDGSSSHQSEVVDPFEHLADTVVVESSDDGFLYDRWLFTYDISGTGRGVANLNLRNDFTATDRSDGIRLSVTSRNDALGFAVLNPVVAEDQAAVLRTLLSEHLLLTALPAEPVGVGAVWTSHTIGTFSNHVFGFDATLTLAELHDDHAVVNFKQVAHSRPPEEQTSGFGGLLEWNLDAEGTITYRFDLPVPLYDITVNSFQKARISFGDPGVGITRYYHELTVELVD